MASRDSQRRRSAGRGGRHHRPAREPLSACFGRAAQPHAVANAGDDVTVLIEQDEAGRSSRGVIAGRPHDDADLAPSDVHDPNARNVAPSEDTLNRRVRAGRAAGRTVPHQHADALERRSRLRAGRDCHHGCEAERE